MTESRSRWLLVVACLAQFMVIFDVSIVSCCSASARGRP